MLRMSSLPFRGSMSEPLMGTLLWQDAESDDPDLGFRFLVPHGAQVTVAGPLVGFILRRANKPPELQCQRVTDGWSLTAVVGFSKVFLSTRALRLPGTSGWRATVGRLLDRPLRGLVQARLSINGEDGWVSTVTDQHRSLISVKHNPPIQVFRGRHFPLRVVLPGSEV